MKAILLRGVCDQHGEKEDTTHHNWRKSQVASCGGLLITELCVYVCVFLQYSSMMVFQTAG